MRDLSKILLLTAAAALAACGDLDKDPLKNHEDLKRSVPATGGEPPQKDSTTIPVLYTITKGGEARFVQGAKGQLELLVQTFFSEPVPYRLDVIESPAGATLSQTNGGEWIFSWAPGTLLTSAETERSFNLQLRFVPLSPLGRAEFAGADDITNIELTLMKDASQPFIEENVTVSPAAEVNADQQVTITFVATGGGLTKPEDMEIDRYGGPEQPAKELVQLNGLWGVLGRTEKVKSLGKDDQGRLRQQFRLAFDARPFADMALAQIQANPGLKAKFDRGDLTTAEAVFFLRAVNRYNNKGSAERTINLKVNLRDKAGPAKFVGDAGIKVLSVGKEASQFFDIRSEGDRGEVKITAVRVGEETLAGTNGKYAFSSGAVTGSLTCKPIAANMRAAYGCNGVSCVLNCSVEVSAPCDAKEQLLTLNIDSESKLGTDTAQKTLDYQINVKGRSAHCPAPAQGNNP